MPSVGCLGRRIGRELIDLHIHVGGAVAPHVLWSLAHNQGFKLPTKNYFEFVEMITARPENVSNLDDYLRIMHTWTEKIQSSPMAIERSVYEVIGKEFRGSRVTQIELRFNPMKRNLDSTLDLDHIIHAALRGMDRATLEYGVRAGLIFCLAREFDPRLNSIILEKAIRYRPRGVVGIDLAGTETRALELDREQVSGYEDLFQRARASGLKTTVHTGETHGTGAEGVMAVVDRLRPHRIGHGTRLVENGDEAAPRAGRGARALPDLNLHPRGERVDELRHIVQTFLDRG
jgi:adenosine deaminase